MLDESDTTHGSTEEAPDGDLKELHLSDSIHAYSEDEILELDQQRFSEAEMLEYDRDWASAADGSSLEHSPDDFENVIQSHDYIFVNFFAEWCSHCREFGPTWDEFAGMINGGEVPLHDGDGNTLTSKNFRVLKINCVDFEETCMSEHVRGFPTVRLYKRSLPSGTHSLFGNEHNYVQFFGDREVEDLLEFATKELKEMHRPKDVHYHHIFDKGCKLVGHTEVSRVPGTLHFEATHSRDLSLNYIFTNASHTVNHLSFSSEDDEVFGRGRTPHGYADNAANLDGRSFITKEFHESPHHYMQVVSTLFTQYSKRSYQLTHQHRMSKASRSSSPQAKFSYSLSPVEVEVTFGSTRWYEFITKMLAIIGGAFTSMGLFQMFMSSTYKRVMKENMGKLG